MLLWSPRPVLTGAEELSLTAMAALFLVEQRLPIGGCELLVAQTCRPRSEALPRSLGGAESVVNWDSASRLPWSSWTARTCQNSPASGPSSSREARSLTHAILRYSVRFSRRSPRTTTPLLASLGTGPVWRTRRAACLVLFSGALAGQRTRWLELAVALEPLEHDRMQGPVEEPVA